MRQFIDVQNLLFEVHNARLVDVADPTSKVVEIIRNMEKISLDEDFAEQLYQDQSSANIVSD